MGWTTYPDRAAWLVARRAGIGSSDAPAIWGKSRFRSRLKVWAEKMGRLEDDEHGSRFAKAGRYLEPAVAQWFASETGLIPTRGVGGHAIYWAEGDFKVPLFATPDYIIPSPSPADWARLGVRRSPPDGPGVLEIKTTSAHLAEAWGDDVPLEYQIQVQHQMLALGYEWGIVCVLIGGNDLRWFLVRIDDEFVDAHLTRCEKFWERVIQRIEPVAMMEDREILGRMYRRPAECTIEIHDRVILDGDERAQMARERIEIDTEIVKDHEARVMQAMLQRGASVATLPSGASYSLTVTKHAAQSIQRKAYETTTLRRRKPKEDSK